MAFSKTPTNLFANWSSDGTNVTLPIASLPELTSAEANASTGDLRKIVFALLERLFAWYNGLATADRPTKLAIGKAATVNTATGKTSIVYTIRLEATTVAQEISDEPT